MIDKTLARALTVLLEIAVPLVIVLDSKNLFDWTAIQRNSVHNAARPDVRVICFEFEMDIVRRFVCVPRRESLADPATKHNSPQQDALRTLIVTGRLPTPSVNAITRSSEQSLG